MATSSRQDGQECSPYQPVEKRSTGGSPACIFSWKTQAIRLCYGFFNRLLCATTG